MYVKLIIKICRSIESFGFAKTYKLRLNSHDDKWIFDVEIHIIIGRKINEISKYCSSLS